MLAELLLTGSAPCSSAGFWERPGISKVLNDLLEGRQPGFTVEHAVFVATLHRLLANPYFDRKPLSPWMSKTTPPPDL